MNKIGIVPVVLEIAPKLFSGENAFFNFNLNAYFPACCTILLINAVACLTPTHAIGCLFLPLSILT